uniref:Capsid protein n=1 Tax=Caloscypha fulgens partitivirus 3 TaxID=2778761 RepID=A0A7L8Y974_9VIRU|nr:capsid protein [Caloscypha fulgens partitivirus 3]
MSHALSARLNELKAKSVELTVKDVKLPESSADPLALFESNSAAKSDSANQWIIDVFPSQIPIFMYIMMLASTASSLADHKDHAKSSAATIALYYMTIYQAFFLINDLYVRPSPSAHALTWSESSWKHAFAQFLLTLPVPQSMETIFAQLYASTTDRTANVFFIPTAAGFNHAHFYGRFIPLNFFTHIHDCIATMPGNSSRIAIMNDLLPRIMYKIKSSTPSNTFDSIIADILGVTLNAGTTPGTDATYASSKLYQVFTKVFNPVLFRDFHRRSSLASLDLTTPVFKSDNGHVNPYDAIFAATPQNLKELKVVLQAVSSIITSTVPCRQTLSSLIASGSGTKILAHGYSDFALPTWSSNVQTGHDAFSKLTTLKAKTLDEYATSISFLTPPATRPTAATTINDVSLDKVGTHVDDRFWPWSLIKQLKPVNPYPRLTTTATDFVTYDLDRSPTPHVLVLDTSGLRTVDAHLATLTGKIIESFELDGSTIELPRSDKSLGMQNCLFADSAIPFKYVIRSTRFYPRDPGSLPLPLARASPNSRPRLPASSLLHDRTKISLPRIAYDIQEATAPTGLPGLSMLDNADWIRYVQSFLGFRTVSNDNATAQDDVPHMEYGRIYLFSPYTYTSYEDNENDTLVPDLNESRHYFLSNLRTIFGTDTNLIELKHPFEALPVL